MTIERLTEPIAIVQSVHESDVREINALEQRIVKSEDDADARLWEQAGKVVEALKGGMTQRQLAAQWINARTGKAYSHTHIQIVVAVASKLANADPRPRFRDAYNEVANAKPGGGDRKSPAIMASLGDCRYREACHESMADLLDALKSGEATPPSRKMFTAAMAASEAYFCEIGAFIEEVDEGGGPEAMKQLAVIIGEMQDVQNKWAAINLYGAREIGRILNDLERRFKCPVQASDLPQFVAFCDKRIAELEPATEEAFRDAIFPLTTSTE